MKRSKVTDYAALSIVKLKTHVQTAREYHYFNMVFRSVDNGFK